MWGLVTICSAYLSDRFRYRGLSTIAVSLIALPGFAIFLCKFHISNLNEESMASSSHPLATSNPHVAYGSLFLSVSGVYATPPTLSSWMANNSEPHYRRATSVAMGFVATNAVRICLTVSFESLSLKTARHREVF